MTPQEEIEHLTNVLVGCESINAGEYKSYESHYAQTVLRLHAEDAGIIVGAENYVKTIKSFAGNVIEWIKDIIAAIIKYFRNMGIDKVQRDKDIAALKMKVWDQTMREIMHTRCNRIYDTLIGDADALALEAKGITQDRDIINHAEFIIEEAAIMTKAIKGSVSNFDPVRFLMHCNDIAWGFSKLIDDTGDYLKAAVKNGEVKADETRIAKLVNRFTKMYDRLNKAFKSANSAHGSADIYADQAAAEAAKKLEY